MKLSQRAKRMKPEKGERIGRGGFVTVGRKNRYHGSETNPEGTVDREEVLTELHLDSTHGQRQEEIQHEKDIQLVRLAALKDYASDKTVRRLQQAWHIPRETTRRLKKFLGEFDPYAEAKKNALRVLGTKPEAPPPPPKSAELSKPTIKSISKSNPDGRSKYLQESMRTEDVFSKPLPDDLDEFVYIPKHECYAFVLRRRPKSKIVDVVLLGKKLELASVLSPIPEVMVGAYHILALGKKDAFPEEEETVFRAWKAKLK